jgi:hypothetical protein
MSYAFISHAEEDRESTVRLCDLLKASSISSWVSFRDIPAGAEWSREIERALRSSNAVIVLATPFSTQSSYVRAEVEYALYEQRTVVPVTLGNVTLPLRWNALQRIPWDQTPDDQLVTKIRSALPPAAKSALVECLNDPSREEDLKRLILPIPNGFRSNTECIFTIDISRT